MPHTVGKRLLTWYDRHRRDLPWRKTTDPYKIWVSEIMLQQTQVQTVIGYYQRWLSRFPSVGDLAAAPEGEVLRAWQGLGYYRRAQNMHRAAKEVVRSHRGKFPRDPDALRRLPGIGAYSSGAIASIAFNDPALAVDVNVLRVMARLLGEEQPVARADVRERLQRRLRAWMPAGKARWFNQAWMELGALVCVAREPRCLLCPLRQICKAAAEGKTEAIPATGARPVRKKIQVVAGVLRDAKNRILIQQRPSGGLMGDLWEFPGGKVEVGETPAGALRREWKEELGQRVRVGPEWMRIRHAYTRFDVDLRVFPCKAESGRPKALWARSVRWVAVPALNRYAYPSANAKIVRRLMKENDLAKEAPAR